MQKKLGEIHFLMRNEKHSSAAFLPNFWLFPWPTVQHWSKNTCKTLPSLFFWCSLPLYQVSSRLEHFDFFLFQGYPLCIIFRFWSLRPQQGASKLQNHFPAYFFDGPHQSCKFRPDWSTLNFFSSKGPPFGYFPDFDKMQKSCIFCFSRYGPHFLTRYSGLPQEQF